jgi:hypothetical protein
MIPQNHPLVFLKAQKILEPFLAPVKKLNDDLWRPANCRCYGSENLRSVMQKDLFDSIGQTQESLPVRAT